MNSVAVGGLFTLAGVALGIGGNLAVAALSNRRAQAERRQGLRVDAYGNFVRDIETAREKLNDDDARNNLRRANEWLPMVGTDDAVAAADRLKKVTLGETTGDFDEEYKSFVSAARKALKTNSD